MNRAVVSVAVGGNYSRGQDRLRAAVLELDPGAAVCMWRNSLPKGCPSHQSVQYAFKAYALREAMEKGHELLLWCDASILPIKPLDELWARIERDGYLVRRNGYWNSEWTNIATLPLLGVTAGENEKIEHVVATCFGLNVAHPTGKAILDEYFRLSQNGSFCGPWVGGVGVQHRHDQAGLSAIMFRLGLPLSEGEWFSYGKAGDPNIDRRVITLADGSVFA